MKNKFRLPGTKAGDSKNCLGGVVCCGTSKRVKLVIRHLRLAALSRREQRSCSCRGHRALFDGETWRWPQMNAPLYCTLVFNIVDVIQNLIRKGTFSSEKLFDRYRHKNRLGCLKPFVPSTTQVTPRRAE